MGRFVEVRTQSSLLIFFTILIVSRNPPAVPIRTQIILVLLSQGGSISKKRMMNRPNRKPVIGPASIIIGRSMPTLESRIFRPRRLSALSSGRSFIAGTGVCDHFHNVGPNSPTRTPKNPGAASNPFLYGRPTKTAILGIRGAAFKQKRFFFFRQARLLRIPPTSGLSPGHWAWGQPRFGPLFGPQRGESSRWLPNPGFRPRRPNSANPSSAR